MWAVVLDVEDDQGGGHDFADPPWVEADVAERSARHFGEGVAAFTDRTQAVVCLVELLFRPHLVWGCCSARSFGVRKATTATLWASTGSVLRPWPVCVRSQAAASCGCCAGQAVASW